MKAPTKKNVPDKPWLAVDVYICPKGEEDGEAIIFCNAERLMPVCFSRSAQCPPIYLKEIGLSD